MSGIKIPPLKNTDLFKSITVGENSLSNKVVFAPTTRFRALSDYTPSNLALGYYAKRSQYPGSLLVTEATLISESAGLYANVPGIWNDKHVAAWKKITDKVHENGSFISSQLWALGRVADPKLLKDNGLDLISSSPIYPDENTKKNAEAVGNPIRALTEEEIHDIIYNRYTKAAENALAAGFDYIEIHGANGYLVDQFLQPGTNTRTDKYGGSIENRARFALELVDQLIKVVGADKLAIRISPFSKFQAMKAEDDTVHPITTFGYLLHELQKRADNGNKLAYVSVVEARHPGNEDAVKSAITVDTSFVGQVWKGVILKAGNYTYDTPHFKNVLKDVSNDRTLVGFARFYTSNPDFVKRLYEGWDLVPYDRNTFYTRNNWRYNTWTNYDEEENFNKEDEINRVAEAIEGIEVN